MKIIKEIISWMTYILTAFVIAMLINVFVFQRSFVEGHSMEPTLHDNDKVYVSKLINIFHHELEYGDIVIIDSQIELPRTIVDDVKESVENNLITNILFGTEKEEKFWIKRVIGKAGDIIEFRDDKVIRNGEILSEPYIKEQANYMSVKKFVVPENHVFVMGDNRNNSRDSRSIGSVPLNHIIGKYKFRY